MRRPSPFTLLCTFSPSSPPRQERSDVLQHRSPLAEGRARADMGASVVRACPHSRLHALRTLASRTLLLSPLKRVSKESSFRSRSYEIFQSPRRSLVPSLPSLPRYAQILAHQPTRAKALTRHKSAQLSVATACNTIMKPPSPLVRTPHPGSPLCLGGFDFFFFLCGRFSRHATAAQAIRARVFFPRLTQKAPTDVLLFSRSLRRSGSRRSSCVAWLPSTTAR